MKFSSLFRGPAAAALGVSLVVTGFARAESTSSARSANTVQALETYGKLPLRFEPAARQGAFIARGLGYGLQLESASATLALRHSENRAVMLRMRLEGASASAPGSPLGELPGVSHYLTGSPDAWRTDVRGYERVRYSGVYEGVDVVYYGNQGKLEYDFLIAPGATPDAVRLGFDGATGITVDGSGALVIGIAGGEIWLQAPVAYQELATGREIVACRYELLEGGRVGFTLGTYDRSLPLVIDPVLAYSTYLGGSLDDAGRDIAVDASGNAYIVGDTASTDFPTQAPISPDPSPANFDAFVTKVNPGGTALVFSSFIGGDNDDRGRGVAIDPNGTVYVAGFTNSTDLPVIGGFQVVPQGGPYDAFLVRLNPAGNQITYGTYLGGDGDDRAAGVASDGLGNAYLTGFTEAADFPTVGQVQLDPLDEAADVFVSKIDTNATSLASLTYSTYLGGAGEDFGNAIVHTAGGQVYVTGVTSSADFVGIVTSGFQPTAPAGSNAFVTRLNTGGPTAAQIVYGTYLGGTGNDEGRGIAADQNGNVYVVGTTLSTNFPVKGQYQLDPADGTSDAFVTRINTGVGGTAGLVYSTYLGGAGQEEGASVAIDGQGNAYVTGVTASANFPVKNQILGDPGDTAPDAYVTKVSTTAVGAASLVYSTYLGGNGNDAGTAIAVDGDGNAFVTGYTGSLDYPTSLGVFQLARAGVFDGFVTKLTDAVADLSILKQGTPDPVTSGSNITYVVQVFNSGPSAVDGVVVTDAIPTGATFVSANATQGTCTTPSVGGTGTIVCSLGSLTDGDTAVVTIVLKATANPGATISNTATVTSPAQDPNGANNSATEITAVISPVPPPVVTSVTRLKGPFRIKITGTNLQPGAQVYIGPGTTPNDPADDMLWTNTKFKGSTQAGVQMIVLKKGSALKAKLPKGVPVQIRIVNPDGGQASVLYTR